MRADLILSGKWLEWFAAYLKPHGCWADLRCAEGAAWTARVPWERIRGRVEALGLGCDCQVAVYLGRAFLEARRKWEALIQT